MQSWKFTFLECLLCANRGHSWCISARLKDLGKIVRRMTRAVPRRRGPHPWHQQARQDCIMTPPTSRNASPEYLPAGRTIASPCTVSRLPTYVYPRSPPLSTRRTRPHDEPSRQYSHYHLSTTKRDAYRKKSCSKHTRTLVAGDLDVLGLQLPSPDGLNNVLHQGHTVACVSVRNRSHDFQPYAAAMQCRR